MVEYTTFRKISEEVAQKACKKIDKSFTSKTKQTPYLGAKTTKTLASLKEEFNTLQLQISWEQFHQLTQHYGCQYQKVLTVIQEDPSYQKPIGNTSHLWGEICYTIRYEMVKTAEDFLRRRTHIQLYDPNWKDYVPKINMLIKQESQQRKNNV